MDNYFYKERLARIIARDGVNSLSIAEENVLKQDSSFREYVDSSISKINRYEMLGKGEYARTSFGEFPKTSESEFLIQWEFDYVAREAQLFRHESGKSVLEIKEWSIDNFYGAINVGAHAVIFQRPIEYNDTKELSTKCKKILTQYGCPEEKIDDNLFFI